MWNSGPECAAQQAKYVPATASSCGERNASPAVMPPATTPPATTGAGRSNSAAGTITAQASPPIPMNAARQPNSPISQVANGAINSEPIPVPAVTSATANPRCLSNQRAALVVSGAM